VPNQTRRSWNWLIGAIGIAAICRIYLALFTYGTNDASMWESSASLIQETGGRSIYEHLVEVRDPNGRFLHYQIFNHPPFMIFVLSKLKSISNTTGMPVRSSLRLMDTVADAFTVLLTAAILESMLGAIPLAPMILVAIAPAWMFISGFHANSDPLMLLFLVLTVYLIEVRHSNTWGALSFAVATGIKIVPLFLLPALLWYFPTWRDRLRTLLIVGIFWCLTAFPWLASSPAALIHNTVGYSSTSGHWGVTYVLSHLPVVGKLLVRLFSDWVGRLLLISSALIAAWQLNRNRRTVSLFYQFPFLLFLFLFLTPGFGIQYLAWLTPWIGVLPFRAVATFYLAGSAFCASVYTYWSGGLPWYYANSIAAGPWHGTISLLGLVSWIGIAAILVTYGRRFPPLQRSSPPSGMQNSSTQIA
jgi:hypothetical protein